MENCTAIGTAVAAVATTCVLVFCVIEVTPQEWFGPGDDASSAPIHSAEDHFAAFGCGILSAIVATFKLGVLFLVLFLALSGPSTALQACAFRRIAWWPHAMAVLGAACIAVALVYVSKKRIRELDEFLDMLLSEALDRVSPSCVCPCHIVYDEASGNLIVT